MTEEKLFEGEKNPGTLASDILDQDEFWVDRAGVRHRIDEMGEGHLSNTLAFLSLRAPKLFRKLQLSLAFSMTGYDAELDLDRFATPQGWLDSTPLVRAIHSRLAELLQLEEEAAAAAPLARLMEEILTEFEDRGNRVSDWPADEAAAYRDNLGFQEGRDAVRKLRAAKAAARIQEEFIEPLLFTAGSEGFTEGVNESQWMTDFTDETRKDIFGKTSYRDMDD